MAAAGMDDTPSNRLDRLLKPSARVMRLSNPIFSRKPFWPSSRSLSPEMPRSFAVTCFFRKPNNRGAAIAIRLLAADAFKPVVAPIASVSCVVLSPNTLPSRLLPSDTREPARSGLASASALDRMPVSMLGAVIHWNTSLAP